jgi:hypothetical protein
LGVRFAYYDRLSKAQQKTYRQSDAVRAVRLPAPSVAVPLVEALRAALQADRLAEVQRASQSLADALCAMLRVEPVSVTVLAVRPRFTGGELHGLYQPGEETPSIHVWMRTAAHARVVAFRTFLRTLLHELLHHLDLSLLGLAWSFHTQGFFQRESSLFHQLVPDARAT